MKSQCRNYLHYNNSINKSRKHFDINYNVFFNDVLKNTSVYNKKYKYI